MRRLAVTIAIVASLVCASVALAAGVVSFPADGHAGPWYSSGTLHGNTVKVSSSGSWSVNYCIQSNASGTWGCDGTSITRSGSGDDTFSVGYSVTCVPFLLYRTHVHNNDTGGTSNKPSGGAGVSAC